MIIETIILLSNFLIGRLDRENGDHHRVKLDCFQVTNHDKPLVVVMLLIKKAPTYP